MNKNYSELKVKELREICKERGLTVYKHKNACTKQELIQKLEEYDKEEKEIFGEDEKVESDKKEAVEVEREETKESIVVEEEKENKERTRAFDYDKMQVGSFAAFRYRDKMQTAKVVAINRKKRLIRAETKMQTLFEVPFERIIWVKIKPEEWWPKAVFFELKGMRKCQWEGTVNEPESFRNKRECKKIITCEEGEKKIN